MRPQPLISVTDVPRSSRWHQEVLGCESGHGGEEYERLLPDGTQHGPSVRLLEKAGFVLEADVRDEELGTVWRFGLHRARD